MTNTAVVTGANKGIGLETVRQLLDRGWTVWLGSRDAERGAAAVASLAAEGRPGEVHALDIDVTDDTSVAAAADTVRAAVGDAGLDVLVNNAGIPGAVPPVDQATGSDVQGVLDVNVVGPVRVTRAFLPILRAAPAPRVINVSSGLGSFAFMVDPSRQGADYPDLAYPVSKAALNMVTVQYAKHVPEVRFVAVGPGYTATDLNGHTGHQTVQEAGANVLAVIEDETLASPSYVSAEGAPDW